jgi:hypothetical protein
LRSTSVSDFNTSFNWAVVNSIPKS